MSEVDDPRSAPLVEAKESTLHQRILSDLEGKIVSGEWPVGHRMPFEVDLAMHYRCSRMTVNKVLTQLARAGLIDRVKGSGSFVKLPQAQSAVLEITDISKEVESLKLPYAFAITKKVRRKATNTDLFLLEVDAGSPILDLTCVHHAGERPFCVEERLISLDSVPDAADVDFSMLTPGQWLVSQVPWSSAKHRIHAVAADPAIASLLSIPEGTPCLVMHRWTWSGTGPVTYVRLSYPGDRHSLVANFTPAS